MANVKPVVYAAAGQQQQQQSGDVLTTYEISATGAITASGVVTAQTVLQSSTTVVVICPTGTGSVVLRPCGSGSTTGQVIVSSTGVVTASNKIVADGYFESSNTFAVVGVAGGTVFLRPGGLAVTTGQLSVAVTGAVTINGQLNTSGNTVVGKTETAGDNSTNLASTAYVRAAAPNASYRTILDCSGSHTAAKVAGTYALGQGDPVAISGTGTLYPITLISIKAADYPSVDGLAPKLRIRAQVAVNDVAPTGNFTFGLYPVTRPATSGGAGLCIYTLGTVVTGSNGATVSAPAADSLSDLVGSDFALPADGIYCIGVVTTATVAASSHMHINAQLQMRNN
jgi:hypothetical protein